MTVGYEPRVRGCLLGGAIGDALGAPVEFMSLARIRSTYGDGGVADLEPDGWVTDDTQMTLFTVEALIEHAEQGTVGGPTAQVYSAYLRWLRTQNDQQPPADATGLAAEPWLYARRAPGNACLSGLSSGGMGTLASPVNPRSKGCGTVMRAAPFGLVRSVGPKSAFEHALHGSLLTHGHPTGYLAAGAFAAIVRLLLDGIGLPVAVQGALDLLATYDHHRETSVALRAAIELADSGAPTAEKLEELGGGWIAEEALAIGVYAALCHQEPGGFADAVRLAVSHSGDSDSTGSICGNLLGAQFGEPALPSPWVARVEGRESIQRLADRFVRTVD